MSATRQAYQAVDTDSTPVRGTIVEERGSSRRVQMAISTYHANQHLEERYEFTAALGIDEYA
jgi:hypothetical protein